MKVAVVSPASKFLALTALLAAASGIWTAPAVAAAQPKAVVELFTSQGCSSCPPADANLSRLADKPGVLALSYHVDYWDYLGWKDTLATPENTERQRGYGNAFASRSVYTPQAVVNGRKEMNGASAGAIEAAIAEMGETTLAVAVSMRRIGDSVVIETGAAAADGGAKGHLLLVFFTPKADVVVERGENAGKTISYRNAVTAVQAAGMWKGETGRWEIPISEFDKQTGGGAAVLLQSMKGGVPGPILGAAVLER